MPHLSDSEPATSSSKSSAKKTRKDSPSPYLSAASRLTTHDSPTCSSYFSAVNTGINTRENAQLLIESSVFENSGTKAIYSADSDVVGYAVVNDVNLGGSANTAAKGTLTSVPYSYSKLGSGSVKSSVTSNAGQKLSF